MRIGSMTGTMSTMQMKQIYNSGNRVFVPVRPSQAIVAQFKYIAGTPAAKDQQTVPLTRIHILNSLINNLNKASDKAILSSQIDSSQVDPEALINQYAGELHRAISATPDVFGTFSGSSNIGILFQVSA